LSPMTFKLTDFEMQQGPEFFMGGDALLSKPRNHMAFPQMLLMKVRATVRRC
jgi:hypothetical protein